MQPDLDDMGGAKELALHRISVARDDLEAAEMNFEGGHYRSITGLIMQYSELFQHVWL